VPHIKGVSHLVSEKLLILETYIQKLRSRSKFLHAWKGLVSRQVYAKYKRYNSFSIGAMINFRNLNADFET